jgi:hypothetical protein
MREALRTALAAGVKSLADKEALSQTGYARGVFLVAPFGLSVPDEAGGRKDDRSRSTI